MKKNNNTQEDYVSFEVSKLLKERGFDVIVSNVWCNNNGDIRMRIVDANCLWDNEYFAPTIQLAVKWIYENFGIWIEVIQTDLYNKFFFQIKRKDNTKLKDGDFNSPQETYQAAINYVLKNF